MTAIEIRNEVTSKFSESQEISLRVQEDYRNKTHTVKVKIIKFYPSSVLTEHNGYNESYTYWDIKTMTDPPKPKKIVVPEKFGRCM